MPPSVPPSCAAFPYTPRTKAAMHTPPLTFEDMEDGEGGDIYKRACRLRGQQGEHTPGPGSVVAGPLGATWRPLSPMREIGEMSRFNMPRRDPDDEPLYGLSHGAFERHQRLAEKEQAKRARSLAWKRRQIDQLKKEKDQ